MDPGSKVHGTNMGPTWVLPAPDRPHVGPMNLAIRGYHCWIIAGYHCTPKSSTLVLVFRWESNQSLYQIYVHDSAYLMHKDDHTLPQRHNERNGVSNHRRFDCLFRRRSKKTLRLNVTGLCEGNSSVTDECPAQRGSKAENVSILWRHHEFVAFDLIQEWVPIANIYSF